MPTRMMRLRLKMTKERSAELFRISRWCARMATWIMQRYRATEEGPPRLPNPLPTCDSGPKAGRRDWEKCLGKPPPAKLSRKLYRQLREAFPEINSNVVDQVIHATHKKYRSERFRILTGQIRTPEYRDLQPIPFRDGAARLLADGRPGGLLLEAAVYSKVSDGPSRLTIPLWGSVDKLPLAWRATLEQYTEAGVMPRVLIHRTGPRTGPRHRGRWLLSIPYKIEYGGPSLMDDRVLVVSRPRPSEFLRCEYKPRRGRPRYEPLEYASAWAAFDRIEAVRAAQQQRYRQQQEPCGRKGHGRKRALECFTKHRSRSLNRQKSFNYNAARTIVTFAQDWKCGVIEFEDLGLVPKHLRGVLALGDWSYYQLKQRLALLCEECGIVLHVVDPPEAEIEDDENEYWPKGTDDGECGRVTSGA